MCEQAYCEKRNRQECIAANSLTSQLIVYLTQAAEYGHRNAMIMIAACYQNGLARAKSIPVAVRWYEKAAAKQSAVANYHLAMIYERGLVIGKDLTKAASLYSKAIDINGFSDAKERLAALYAAGGEGFPANYELAKDLYIDISRRGDMQALFQAGRMCVLAGAPDEAVTYLLKALRQGHTEADALITTAMNQMSQPN